MYITAQWYVVAAIFMAGILVGWGSLVALPDHFSNRVTSRDKLGLFLIVLGFLALIGGILLPMAPIFGEALTKAWNNSNGVTLAALGATVVFLFVGVIMHRHAHHPHP